MRIKRIKIPRVLTRVVQFLVTIALFYYLIRKSDFNSAVKILSDIDVWYFLLSFILLICANLTLVLSWFLIIKKIKLNVSLGTVIAVFFQSLFVNNFLTFIGGDVFKGVRINAHTGKKFETGFSLVISRFMMFYSLIIFTGISFVRFGKNFGSSDSVKWLGYLILFLCAAYAVFVKIFSKKNYLRDNDNRAGIFKRLLIKAGNNHIIFGESFQFFLLILLINLSGHFIGFISVKFLGTSLGLSLSLVEVVALMSILRLVLMVPVSFNGFGLREIGFVALLTKLGYQKAESLSLGLTQSISTLLMSLLGGLILIIELGFIKKKDSEGQQNGIT